MRIKINFKGQTNLPFSNQHLVNSYIHKCLGNNNMYHNSKSDYNISFLMGGKMNEDKKTLYYNNNAYIIVSSLNTEFLNNLLIGIINNQNFGELTFSTVDYINETFYDGWNHFRTLSPFLIKEYTDKKNYTFLTINDNDFKNKVKEYLIKKLIKIDSSLKMNDFDVIINNHPGHKIKKILIKNVINHANMCHISIFTNKKVAELLYNIGIGQSTGSGFGTIYKTENKKLYF